MPCKDGSTSYPLGTALIHVYFLTPQGSSSGIGPPGNHTREPWANLTLSAQAGGDMNVSGEEFARGATDSHGCIAFQLPRVGRYRFEVVGRSSSCDPEGTVAADWNGTALLQLQLGPSSPCN